jgi:hypothetical protein
VVPERGQPTTNKRPAIARVAVARASRAMLGMDPARAGKLHFCQNADYQLTLTLRNHDGKPDVVAPNSPRAITRLFEKAHGHARLVLPHANKNGLHCCKPLICLVAGTYQPDPGAHRIK